MNSMAQIRPWELNGESLRFDLTEIVKLGNVFLPKAVIDGLRLIAIVQTSIHKRGPWWGGFDAYIDLLYLGNPVNPR